MQEDGEKEDLEREGMGWKQITLKTCEEGKQATNEGRKGKHHLLMVLSAWHARALSSSFLSVSYLFYPLPFPFFLFQHPVVATEDTQLIIIM